MIVHFGSRVCHYFGFEKKKEDFFEKTYSLGLVILKILLRLLSGIEFGTLTSNVFTCKQGKIHLAKGDPSYIITYKEQSLTIIVISLCLEKEIRLGIVDAIKEFFIFLHETYE